jgi:hypothetical protein
VAGSALALPARTPPTVLRYDPLERPVRTDTPQGFFSTVAFSPWRVTHYDACDTVRDSKNFRTFPANPTTQDAKNERDALDKAAVFHNTPSIQILDNLGRVVRTIRNNLGAVRAVDLSGIAAGSSSPFLPQSIGHQHLQEPELRTKEDAHNFARHRLTKELIDEIWGPDAKVETRTVDVHIRRLRDAITRGVTVPMLPPICTL